jgi:flagellar biosynthesis protein FlhF
MRSKRYFAEDLRSAVLIVRQELGPNAIILAHQRIQSGVEVTAVPGKEALEYPRTTSVNEVDDGTLGVKEVRDSFESSVKDNIPYFNADANEISAATTANTVVHSAVKKNAIEDKDVAYRGKLFSAGDTIMHDKTGKSSRQDNSDRKKKDTIDYVEYDFEAEMNTILNTHYVSLNSDQHLIESKPVKIKAKKTTSVQEKKPETKNKRKSRSESKVHTALSKLKIKPEEKQTVIRSSKTDLPEESIPLPPVLSKSHNYDQIIDSIELKIGEYAYGDAAKKNPVKAALIRQLMKLDLSPVIIQNVVDMLVSDKIDQKMLLPQAMALVANQIPIYKEDITSIGGTIALFGATGVGKTTTIAKLAARYALKHGSEKVALITTDNNRIAATEQLRTYSNILGMPLRVATNDIEVLNALNTFSEKEFVLIDTAGMNPREIKQSKFYDLFSGGITQIKKFQVLPATMHRTALEKISASFRDLSPDGSIITKVDETTSLGGAISVAIQNHLPIAFYGNGQTVPDDFHLARAHILMSRVASVAMQFDEQESDDMNDQLTPGIASNVSF